MMVTEMVTTLNASSSAVVAGRTPHVRHVYCRCTREKNPRVAYCGHVSGPLYGVPYDPKMADLCKVCLEMNTNKCPQCGETT